MRLAELPERIGLGGAGFDGRLAWASVLLALLAYSVSFALYYPEVATNEDEMMYIRQAHLLLDGRAVATARDPLSGLEVTAWPSTYPAGTASLMAPGVWAFGWRGAFLAPLLGLLAAVLITARWISEEHRSPAFALLVLGFLPSLVMGRMAMSDAPSMAVVALGFWLFWRGLDRGAGWWYASSFVAGASLLLREGNVVPFLPLYAGALLRRDRGVPALVIGGLAGVSVRLVANYLSFGDLLYTREAYPFSPWTLGDRLPLYLFGLLVLVPGGGPLALAYRGRRRPELIAALVLFFLFNSFQFYSAAGSEPATRLVLGLRYLLPMIPLLAFTAAESTPRLWTRAAPGARARSVAGATLAAGIAATLVAGVAIHPIFDHWSRAAARIRDEIAVRVERDSVVITNLYATNKFIPVLDLRLRPIERKDVTSAQVASLRSRYESVLIVLLDRGDSEYWRSDAVRNQAFVDSLEAPPALELDVTPDTERRLRIWRVTSSRAEPGSSTAPRR